MSVFGRDQNEVWTPPIARAEGFVLCTAFEAILKGIFESYSVGGKGSQASVLTSTSGATCLLGRGEGSWDAQVAIAG